MRLIFAAFLFMTISARAVPINEIHVEGDVGGVDQVQTLKTLTGFLPGDEFDQTRNQRAIGKLQEYFQEKGYVDVRVTETFDQPKSGKSALRYRIVIGEPLKMTLVEVVSKAQILSDELKKKLLQAVDLKPNELLDRDRLKDMRRAIEVALLAENFIDSKVIDVQTDRIENQNYRAIFSVDLGQQVIFSVSGNQYFTRNELANVIDEQRRAGLGRDYVSVLMNRILDRYVEHGYRSVQITPYTFESRGNEPRKVVFEIEEGRRVRIHDVIFDGQETFSSVQLKEIFFSVASDRIQARIYNDKMVEAAADETIRALKMRGYLSAKSIAIKTEDSPSGGVDVRIFVNEGVQTIVQSVDFTGNHVFSLEQLKSFIGLQEDQPLSLAKLEEGLEKVKREHRNLGYLDVKIVNESAGTLATYSERNQFAFINVEVDEGTQWKYAGLTIFGIEKTKSEVIEREVMLQADEPIAESKLLETEDRLRRLGLFSQVTIELLPSSRAGYKELKVSVSEAIPGNMGFGVGFRNDLGIRLFGEVTYANLRGLNHAAVLNASVNRRLSNFRFVEFSAQAGYIWPWFTWGETTFRPNLSAERRQYIQFDAETFALSASFERMLLRAPKLSASLTYTIERISQFNAYKDPSQNKNLRIGSITPQLKLDMRDHPLTPRRGLFAMASFEYADSILGSQVSDPPVNYGRFQTRTDFYLDFIPRVVWYTSVRGGWLKNFAHTEDQGTDFSIPLIKQFALGGINSMRGYLEQEINVQATDTARRVQNFMTYVNYRTQLDFFASPNLSVGPFLDAGNLNVDRLVLGALQYGSGVGLRYMTPVGPVNFDWGFKLFPKANAETNVFYFSLGVN